MNQFEFIERYIRDFFFLIMSRISITPNVSVREVVGLAMTKSESWEGTKEMTTMDENVEDEADISRASRWEKTDLERYLMDRDHGPVCYS